MSSDSKCDKCLDLIKERFSADQEYYRVNINRNDMLMRLEPNSEEWNFYADKLSEIERLSDKRIAIQNLLYAHRQTHS
jgi:hypothetical protein